DFEKMVYSVHFVPDEVNSANIGVQNPLVCDSGYGCSNDGCQPKVQMPFLVRYASSSTFSSFTGTTPVAANDFTYGFTTSLVTLASTSMPRLPSGVSVDIGDHTAVHADIRV